MFAVGWHRHVLLRVRDTTAAVQFYIGRRELRFFLYDLVFSVPIAVITSVAEALPYDVVGLSSDAQLAVWFGLWATILVIFVLWVRCLLIFPAVAVARDEGLNVAWNQLGGTTWQLFWALCVASIPLVVLLVLVGEFDSSATSNLQNSWPLNIIFVVGQHIIDFLWFAVIVTIISLAFRRKTEWIPTTS